MENSQPGAIGKSPEHRVDLLSAHDLYSPRRLYGSNACKGKVELTDTGEATPATLLRRAVAEGVGTALLLAAVVGSGIMGERLAGGNLALVLLANTLTTGRLLCLILTLGSISGAHLNPAVTLADASQKGLPWSEVPAYLAAQLLGAFAGVAAANLMFREPALFVSHHVRAGAAQIFSEFVATFGLLSVIWGCVRLRSSAVPFAVGAYITAAYWFTSSTSFANPAVTLARCASDTFAGIRPVDVRRSWSPNSWERLAQQYSFVGLCRRSLGAHGT